MKTISIKQVAILILVLLLHTYSSAQLIIDSAMKKKTCDGYMNATYIFEGKLDSSKYFTVKTGEYDYENFTAYLVEVDKVIKGNIKKGTVEIVQYAEGITHKGPDGTSAFQSAEGIPGLPGKGIYLGFDTAGYRMASYFKNSNSKTLRCYGGIPVNNGKIPKDPMGGISLYFSNIADFYTYIKANYGIDVSTK